jgi:secreted protein with Ig-like and vWFA domain
MEGFAYNNMVLLLDVSGSMNSPHKLPLLKKSVKNLLHMLRPKDEVAIVVYSGNAHVLLEPTPGNQIDKISQAIDKLKSDGGTDGNAGLKLAYKVADKNYKRGGNNRIILATDGEFPISSQVYDLVEKGAREDIYLTVFSYSPKESITSNLQRLSERGKGHFEHISPENSDSHLIREAKAKRAR